MTAPGLHQLRPSGVSSLPPQPRWALCDRCDRCDLALDLSAPLCRVCDPRLAAWIEAERRRRQEEAARQAGAETTPGRAA